MKNFAVRLGIPGAIVAIVAVTTSGAAQTASVGQPVFSGSGLFLSYCVTCHGPNGTGDGPMAAMLRKQPANLTLLAQRNGGVFSAEMVARIIDGSKPLAGHGGGDMPAWGDAFGKSVDGPDTSPSKITALVKYLETLQKR